MAANPYLGAPSNYVYIPLSDIYLDQIAKTNFSEGISGSSDTSKLSDPSQTQTDFPPSNARDGNSMVCLEQALLEAVGQGELGGIARDQKLAELRNQGIEIKGSLLKAGGDFNSPIVTDTYTDSEGNRFYKFHVTWELKIKQSEGSDITITKRQWIITGVPQIDRLDDTSSVLFQHHQALLAVKCHIFIQKNGFDKTQKQHDRILRCINDVRRTNLVGVQGFLKENRLTFTTDILDVNCKKDPDCSYQLDSIISKKQPATALCIALRNASDKKVCVYIDQIFTGRKLNDNGTKYDKVPYDPDHPTPRTIPLCVKRQRDAHGMIVRGNKDLSDHIRVLHAGPDELDELLSQSFEGRNARGMTFAEVTKERYKARLASLENAQENVEQAFEQLKSMIKSLYGKQKGFGASLKVSLLGGKLEKMAEKLDPQKLKADQCDQLTHAFETFQTAVSHLKTEDLCVYKLGSKCGMRLTAPKDSNYKKYDDLTKLFQNNL